MKRVFYFEHGTVEIDIPDEEQIKAIKVATEHFMRKVIKERMRNGNCNTSVNI